jgi:hypothetical protein
MTETPALGPSVIGPETATFSEARLRTQRTLAEVQNRAAFANEGDSAETQAALKRLSRLLDSGVPLKANAPRGYYLSFTV